jgi:hypothetical protein
MVVHALISGTQEADIGGSQSKTDMGIIVGPNLANKLKSKITGMWLKWYSACKCEVLSSIPIPCTHAHTQNKSRVQRQP